MWSKLVCIAIITNMIWSQLGVVYASTSHVVKTGVYSNNYKHDVKMSSRYSHSVLSATVFEIWETVKCFLLVFQVQGNQ